MIGLIAFVSAVENAKDSEVCKTYPFAHYDLVTLIFI